MKKTKILYTLLFYIIFGQSCVNLIIRSSDILDEQTKIKIISNHSKRIVFIPMHHAGTKSFYIDVNNRIDSLLNLGYVVFYERVKVNDFCTKEQMDTLKLKTRKITNLDLQKISKTGGYIDTLNGTILGIKTNLIKKYHLINQSTSFLLTYDTLKVKRVDATLDELITATENKFGIIELEKYDFETPLGMDYKTKIDKKRKEYYLLGYRNQLISDMILRSATNKIVLIYGSQHFEGILRNLQQVDKNYIEILK